MILLDTNIISEVMRPQPSEGVLGWLDHHTMDGLWVSSISIAEIHYGLMILPTGQRRELLTSRFSQFIRNGFSSRIVAFDEGAALAYARIMANRKQMGRPMSLPDGQIAAIAQVHGLALATRNTADFEYCDIALINPFD